MNATKPEDSEEDRTRRMALISESVAVFNEGVFLEIRDRLIGVFRAQQYLRSNALPKPLLEEFNVWCKSFIQRIQVQQKYGPKYDKRKHQRLFMQHATLVACLAHALQDKADTFPTLISVFEMPPVIRLYHVAEVAFNEHRSQRNKQIKDVLQLYNDGLASLREYASSDAQSAREEAVKCTDGMVKRFRDLETALLKDADTHLSESYREISPR